MGFYWARFQKPYAQFERPQNGGAAIEIYDFTDPKNKQIQMYLPLENEAEFDSLTSFPPAN